MASRLFAYNSSNEVPSGATQWGSIAVSQGSVGVGDAGLEWFYGPDEASRHIISHVSGPKTKANGAELITGTCVGWWKSTALTDSSFIALAERIAAKYGQGQSFASVALAKSWLNTNGFWTSALDSYTYYRWQITQAKTSPPQANCVQAAEFVFQLNGVDQSMTGVTMSNPSGSNPSGEESSKLIDGLLTTKALDLNFVSNGNVTNFIFRFPTAKSFNGYRWATANDEESRDPKSWTISGSNDNTNWTLLHTVSGFSATTNRQTYQTAQTY
jgi:hypothetical protein